MSFINRLFFSIALRVRLARAVFFLLSDSLDLELKILIRGKLNWYSLNEKRAKYFRLKRNIHRLEKGLINANPKAYFGDSYIESIYLDYSSLKNDVILKDELDYVNDVITAYVNRVKVPPNRVDLFDRLKRNLMKSPLKKIPYKYSDMSMSKGSFESLILRRRSVRYFQKRKVPIDIVKSAILTANQSPSACNRNSLRYHLVFGKDISRLGMIPGGARSFINQVPCLVAVTAQSSSYPGIYDRGARYLDGGLSAMTFMYALTDLGLASCPINWPRDAHMDRQVREVLDLYNDELVLLLVAIGYPKEDGKIPYSQKKSIENTILVYE